MKFFSKIILLLLLVYPYLFLIGHVGAVHLHWGILETQILRFTFLQAFVSAVLILFFGVWGALGLSAINHKKLKRFFQVLFLLPNTLPTLFTILACLNWVRPFPFGFVGIALIQCLLQIGLVAVLVERLLQAKTGGMVELAWIEGAGRFQLLKVLLSYLRHDLLNLFFYVFAVGFTSFSVPLIAGGLSGTTLEVLVYQKIRVDQDWAQALGLSLLQLLFVAVFFLVLAKQMAVLSARSRPLRIFNHPLGLAWPLLAAFIVVSGQFVDFSFGLQSLLKNPELLSQLPHLMLSTILIATATGLTLLFFLLLLAYFGPGALFHKFLIGYATPSAVLCGFSLLVLGPELGVWVYLKIIFGLSLMMAPILYRLSWSGTLSSLRKQIELAEVMGASSWLTFRRVLLPQLIRPACFLVSVAAFWACGEFAFSSVVAGRDLNLALVAQNLMSSYRLELATMIGGLIILSGLVVFVFFGSLGYVFGRKSFS